MAGLIPLPAPSKHSIIRVKPPNFRPCARVETSTAADVQRQQKVPWEGTTSMLASLGIKTATSFSCWRWLFFSCVAMPLLFFIIAWLGGLVMMPMEGQTMRHSFGFMASAVTGGAIRLPGFDYSPMTFSGKICSGFVATLGIGIFGFLTASLTGIEEDQEQNSKCYHIRRLACLALATLLFLTAAAALLGMVVAYLEGWSYYTGWKTLASVSLGGGIPVTVGTPHTWCSEVLLLVVAVWSIQLMAVVISSSGSVVVILLKLDDGSISSLLQSSFLFFALTCFAVPLVLIAAMTLVAAALTIMGEDFMPSFWTALPSVSGGAADVFPVETQSKMPRELAMIASATVGFFLVSLCIAIVQASVSPLIAAMLPASFSHAENQCHTRVYALVALFAGICIFTPLFVAVFALPLGLVLATAEHAEVHEAYWWVVAAQLGGGMDLSDLDIKTIHGRCMGTLTAAWSLGVAGLALGFSGAPAVEPLLQQLADVLTVEKQDLAEEKDGFLPVERSWAGQTSSQALGFEPLTRRVSRITPPPLLDGFKTEMQPQKVL